MGTGRYAPPHDVAPSAVSIAVAIDVNCQLSITEGLRQDGAGTSLFPILATPISLAQIPGTNAGLSGTFWVRHAETTDISSVRSKHYLSDTRAPLKVPYFKAF